ncbi:MAG: zinc metallopeptidase [Bacteroidales bacterium]|jgi:Zn-dependent membrane protease YugP|nr:zinc metallopeptidase [Bacteroidales bacterium]
MDLPLIWIIFGVFALLSWVVSSQLDRQLTKYFKIPINYGLTGRDIAQKMLAENGINDVKVQSVAGKLTDHYNPVTKTINLSEAVFYSSSVGAAAVAAHECGHAVQHARSYVWLTMRSKLVPVVSFASHWVQWVLLAGLLLLNVFPQLLLFGIILFGLTTLFSLITLPVELNASHRALIWLSNANITNYSTYPKARSALKLAAYTYVIAALSSLGMLVYYLMIYLGRQRE